MRYEDDLDPCNPKSTDQTTDSCVTLSLWWYTTKITAMRPCSGVSDGYLIGQTIWVYVPNAMWTDTFHDSSVLTPNQRPVTHVVIRRIVNDARSSITFFTRMHVGQRHWTFDWKTVPALGCSVHCERFVIPQVFHSSRTKLFLEIRLIDMDSVGLSWSPDHPVLLSGQL